MIVIGLSANLSSRFGDPVDTFLAAIDHLAEKHLHPVKLSSLWLTAPVPVSDQPWYHNAVYAVRTTLEPFSLLTTLKQTEEEFGRVSAERNAARVIDLDIICYHNNIVNKERLKVPHPRMHERAFVLKPLYDIAPEWIHPLKNKRIDYFLEMLPEEQGIECANDTRWDTYQKKINV